MDSAAAILPAALDMPLTCWVADYGWAAVFIGAILEGETVVLLAAVLAQQGLVTFNAMLVAAALGAFTGDPFFYHVGRLSRWCSFRAGTCNRRDSSAFCAWCWSYAPVAGGNGGRKGRPDAI